mmetsp:Transcript_2942/g.4292  ORF Transcript_2942/g.4292 Transcript_2942/m.4292 type:complete len:974 (+) Transcript_2942:27-2948(+)
MSPTSTMPTYYTNLQTRSPIEYDNHPKTATLYTNQHTPIKVRNTPSSQRKLTTNLGQSKRLFHLNDSTTLDKHSHNSNNDKKPKNMPKSSEKSNDDSNENQYVIASFSELSDYVNNPVKDNSLYGIKFYALDMDTERWAALCTMLKFRTKLRHIAHLDLGSCGLTDTHIRQVCDSLNQTLHITHLLLGGNSIGNEGTMYLASYLKANRDVLHLNLRHNTIGDSGAAELAKIIALHPSIHTINLGLNQITDKGCKALCYAVVMNKQLVSLNLMGNNITELSAPHLSEMIAYDNRLESLDLWHNQINQEGLLKMAKTLTLPHIHLSFLNIGNNNLKDLGGLIIADIVKRNRTIVHLDISQNNITDKAGFVIASSLLLNNTLNVLMLGGNKLTISSTEALVKALHHHQSLSYVNLMDNILDYHACEKLDEIVQQTQSTVSFVYEPISKPTLKESDFISTLKDEEEPTLQTIDHIMNDLDEPFTTTMNHVFEEDIHEDEEQPLTIRTSLLQKHMTEHTEQGETESVHQLVNSPPPMDYPTSEEDPRLFDYESYVDQQSGEEEEEEDAFDKYAASILSDSQVKSETNSSNPLYSVPLLQSLSQQRALLTPKSKKLSSTNDPFPLSVADMIRGSRSRQQPPLMSPPPKKRQSVTFASSSTIEEEKPLEKKKPDETPTNSVVAQTTPDQTTNEGDELPDEDVQRIIQLMSRFKQVKEPQEEPLITTPTESKPLPQFETPQEEKPSAQPSTTTPQQNDESNDTPKPLPDIDTGVISTEEPPTIHSPEHDALVLDNDPIVSLNVSKVTCDKKNHKGKIKIKWDKDNLTIHKPQGLLRKKDKQLYSRPLSQLSIIRESNDSIRLESPGDSSLVLSGPKATSLIQLLQPSLSKKPQEEGNDNQQQPDKVEEQHENDQQQDNQIGSFIVYGIIEEPASEDGKCIAVHIGDEYEVFEEVEGWYYVAHLRTGKTGYIDPQSVKKSIK